MTATQMDDTLRKLTLGDPDGPKRFIETLGMEVPTYIDPRLDLIPSGPSNKNTAKAFKRVDYHVPFKMRNEFKVVDWPSEYRESHANVRTDIEGFVLCAGTTKAGQLCSLKAVNRTHFCRSHGGALHPADKKLSVNTLVADRVPDRIENLSRIGKFLQGFLKAEDLEDDEIQGNFVRNDDGRQMPVKALGVKFEQAIAKELHARLNRFLQSKASSMLNVMVDIAENDINEPADRIKAAQWVAERVMGKTPEVLIHGTKTEMPYESILAGIESGSREAHRQHVQSDRLPIEAKNQPIDVQSFDIDGPDADSEEQSSFGDGDGFELDSVRHSDEERLHQAESTDESAEASGSDGGFDVAEEIEKERKNRIARAAEIKKIKQRRFAARAVGAKSLDAAPILCSFRPIKGKSEFKVKFIFPHEQTPAIVEKVLNEYHEIMNETDADHTARRQAAADAEVLRLQAQLAKLKEGA